MTRVGQNRLDTLYVTVFLVISLLKKKHRICTIHMRFWPTLHMVICLGVSLQRVTVSADAGEQSTPIKITVDADTG